MNGWHWMTIVLVLVLGYWVGQTMPQLVGGYPAKLFGG